MKRFDLLFVLLATLAAPLAHGQQAEEMGKAREAAERWLALADANDGGATWEQAAPSFRAAVPRAAWPQALAQARKPFGALLSRKLASSAFKRSLPGAPDGEYVVIQYDTRFERKAHAVETVVPMRDADGAWKVSGYFVQ